jgi:hypothetical protein
MKIRVVQQPPLFYGTLKIRPPIVIGH